VTRPHLAAGLAAAAAAAFMGAGLPLLDSSGGYAGLSPRFMPTLVTAALAVCALLLLRRGSVPEHNDDAAGTVAPHDGPRRLAWVAGGLLLHMALIGSIGFVIAGALLMACVARGYGSARPARDVAAGLAMTVPIWLLFAKGLGLSLPLLPLARL